MGTGWGVSLFSTDWGVDDCRPRRARALLGSAGLELCRRENLHLSTQPAKAAQD